MPYKNPEDKAAWRQANAEKSRQYLRAWREERRATRPTCACGCGQRPRSLESRYMAGHQPRTGGRAKGSWGPCSSRSATTSPSVADLAWCAGFLEGEGSFSGPQGASAISAEQKSREPLERLEALLGGTITQRKRGEYHWRVSGARARGIMLTLYVWMSERRRGQMLRAFR